MKATIKDVARASGYSVATVSMALSDKPSRVSEETKRKIREIAKQLDYSPNRIAVSLATKRSKIIGLVIADLHNPHMAMEYMAISSELKKRNYQLVTHVINNGEQYSLDDMKALAGCGIEGIIFSHPDTIEIGEEELKIIEYIKQSGLPVVSRDNKHYEELGSRVCFDYKMGGYMATNHLIEYGHRRIGCLAGTKNLRVTVERLEGYKQALYDAGIELDEKLIYYGDYSIESGSEALSFLLGQKATAIFAFNDEMAFGVYRRARNYGVKIPDDLSIIGFDDVSFDDVLEVPLDSIHVPTAHLGQLVAEKIVNMIEHKDDGKDDYLFEPSLRVRGSTKRI